jgi:hypothetical protein
LRYALHLRRHTWRRQLSYHLCAPVVAMEKDSGVL